MAKGKWLSLGGGLYPLCRLCNPTLQSPVSMTQWALGPSSRQPVCPVRTPDAEIMSCNDSIVSYFPGFLSVILEDGISQAFDSLGLNLLREAVQSLPSPSPQSNVGSGV